VRGCVTSDEEAEKEAKLSYTGQGWVITMRETRATGTAERKSNAGDGEEIGSSRRMSMAVDKRYDQRK